LKLNNKENQFLKMVRWFFSLNFLEVLLGRHATTWATPLALFCVGYFQDRVLWIVHPGWICTMSSWSLPPK
jgi:hypothetical protein